jgi:hypothetical protein
MRSGESSGTQVRLVVANHFQPRNDKDIRYLKCVCNT